MRVKRSDISGYALKFMPSALQEVIFRDEEFCAAVDFKPSFVNTALGDLKIERTSLLRALRAAVNGAKSAKLRTESGLVQATLGRTPEGGATLTVAKTRFALAGAGPLLKVKKDRLAAVDGLFAGRPLTQKEEARWREVAGRALTDEEFSRLSMAIAQTPESVQADLSKPRNISLNDLIPGKSDYYERLIGKWNGEETLQEYIDGSLADHRRWLYENYRSHGIRRMAYAALMPQLVPHEILKDIGASELERLLDVEDPYSLLYVVKVAQSRAITEPKYIPIGTKALNKLFGDQPSVMARLTVFSAAAVASMARLRLVFEDGRVPLYWFRLAAFAHAGVITDAFGSLSDGKDFLKWINGLVGPEYVWNTVVDRREAPRWEPGWIAPDQLYAELVGQACGSIPGAVQQNGPKEWEELLKAQIDKVLIGFVNHPFFPGPMDDFAPIPATPKSDAFVDVEQKLKRAQKIEEATGLVGLSYMSTPGEDVAAEVARLVETLRSQTIATDKEDRFLDIAARVAANSRSTVLADSVIDQCIRFGASSKDENSLARLLQASFFACGAFPDLKAYRLKVGETATRFAYVAGGQFPRQLLLIFDCLRRRDAKLIASLGRARAIVQTLGLRAI